jgi:ankyrin repeat protein
MITLKTAVTLFLFSLVATGCSRSRSANDIEDAVNKGDVKAISDMLRANPRLREWRNAHDETLLHVAVFANRTQSLRTLLANGVDPNHARFPDRWTPLHMAANVGRTEMIDALVGAGANVEARTEDEMTPLLIAAYRHPDAVSQLLHLGVDVNAEGKTGRNGLFISCINDDENVATLLIRAGIDLKHADKLGNTAVDYARENRAAKVENVIRHSIAR